MLRYLLSIASIIMIVAGTNLTHTNQVPGLILLFSGALINSLLLEDAK